MYQKGIQVRITSAHLRRNLLRREELPERGALELDVVVFVDDHVVRDLLDLVLDFPALAPDEALHAVERVLGVHHSLLSVKEPCWMIRLGEMFQNNQETCVIRRKLCYFIAVTKNELILCERYERIAYDAFEILS